MLLVCSINLPMFATICGFMMLIGKLMYTIGYCMKGPKGRVIGAILVDLAIVALLVGCFWSVAKWEVSSNW